MLSNEYKTLNQVGKSRKPNFKDIYLIIINPNIIFNITVISNTNILVHICNSKIQSKFDKFKEFCLVFMMYLTFSKIFSEESGSSFG